MTATPSDFPLDEYQALRKGFGSVELANWSSVTLTGADRQKFLNNFCTNEVGKLQFGESCEAFLTNVKGKVIGHFLAHARDSELVLITVPGQAAKIIEHLDRYIIREDVQLRDTTAERRYVLLAGGTEAGGGILLNEDLYHHVMLAGGTETGVGRNGAVWIRWHLLHVPVCGLLEATPETLPQVRQELTADGATACSSAAFDALRIESGTPLFGVDFDEENLPQEVSRDELAISFTKGCYLGQETVARIDALGHVNQQLAGVRFVGPEIPQPRTELTQDGASAGHVTSATFSPQLAGPLAFALLRRKYLPPGTKLDSPAGACEVVDLPVYAAAN
jgi:folate-binding protein YgfZ